MCATYDKDGKWVNQSFPKPEKKAKGGKSPRQRGNSFERQVAKEWGGTRVPMSGAVKNSVHNLKGDVTVPDANGHAYLLVECKLSGVLNTKGDKVYLLAKAALVQSYEEAKSQNQLGAFRLHFANDSLDDDWVIVKNDMFKILLEHAKKGATC